MITENAKVTKQTTGTRVLVCGGRDYNNDKRVFSVLAKLCIDRGIAVIIHGRATGADSLADRWARAMPSVSILEYPAQWKKHGKAAGPIRNRLMLDDGKPDLVIAFPGGRGTKNMVELARAAGIEVVEIK